VIDPFQTDVGQRRACRDRPRRPHGYIDFRPQLSSIALAALAAERASFGLIYVDGSHLFEDVIHRRLLRLPHARPRRRYPVRRLLDRSRRQSAQLRTANWSGWTSRSIYSAHRADGGSLKYQGRQARWQGASSGLHAPRLRHARLDVPLKTLLARVR
jgi:hypothetical protein